MRSRFAFVILVLVVLANLAAWAWFNRPAEVPDWQGTIRGVSFSPFRSDQDPVANRYPTAEEIAADLRLLQGKTGAIRTYSATNGLEAVPALAAKAGLHVTAGAWLFGDPERDRAEIASLIKIAGDGHVDRVIVGNETLLRSDLTLEQLRRHLREVRQAVSVPVSTAEPWHVWLKYPELAQEVDFITIHLLPYWEGVPIDRSVEWALESYRRVEEAFPGIPVVIGEAGWPSGGGSWEKARASVPYQARFVRQFLNAAEARNLDYFIIEAFDQPWKSTEEGAVGRHWGLFDVDRRPKFAMTGAIVAVPLWPVEATAATLLALAPILLFLARWDNLRRRGQLFFASLIQAAVSLFVWTLFIPWTMDVDQAGRILWGILLPAQAALLLVVLVNGLELTEMLWVRHWRRRFLPLPPRPGVHLPKVSVHLAIYNEPPGMVIETLNALARLDYPDYEVLVVDNNTASEAIWRPVAAHCALLGPRFRFFHLPKWPGYKAGALNFALAQTDPAAAIIGVVDSDYRVKNDWLRALIPYFEQADVGFVQAPQDNRQWQGDLFREMINWEYNGFFQIGMVHRNERNAIIQHGTMTLIRRAAMEKVGRWGEWCICEDAELGLRLLAAGYQSIYVNRNFGDGVTPDTFAGYKGQRFRWACGAVQILRRHWRALLPWSRSGLSAGQRFHFAAGWFPWLTDGLHLLFTFAGIFWTLGMLLLPHAFEFPLAVFLLPTLGLFLFKIIHALALYHQHVPCTRLQSVGAAVAGMALTHTIALAVLRGLCSSRQAFLRTPKGENRPALMKGLLMARQETHILLLLLAAGVATLTVFPHRPEAWVWTLLLAVQGLPYAAALATSLASALPRQSLARFRRRTRIRRLRLQLEVAWRGALPAGRAHFATHRKGTATVPGPLQAVRKTS